MKEIIQGLHDQAVCKWEESYNSKKKQEILAHLKELNQNLLKMISYAMSFHPNW
jgi:hypothetical protein